MIDGKVLIAFLKKTAYALAGSVLAAISLGLSGFVPSGSPLDLQLYAATIAFFTGVVAAAKRWIEVWLGEQPPVEKSEK